MGYVNFIFKMFRVLCILFKLELKIRKSVATARLYDQAEIVLVKSARVLCTYLYRLQREIQTTLHRKIYPFNFFLFMNVFKEEVLQYCLI